MFLAVRGSGPRGDDPCALVRTALCQASRVLIRHAPIADQPAIQPAITRIIAQVVPITLMATIVNG
jgi:hypothetical protein